MDERRQREDAEKRLAAASRTIRALLADKRELEAVLAGLLAVRREEKAT